MILKRITSSIIMRSTAAVLYHYPCPDGVFAALAAHLYHFAVGCSVKFYPNTVYQPLSVQDLKVNEVDVFYLLDFAGPQGFAVDLASKANQVVVLDHHKTALEALPRNGECPKNLCIIIDTSRSGATIAYDYFSKKLESVSHLGGIGLVPVKDEERVHDLYKYVEDRDLWKWALTESKAFSSGLSDMSMDFSTDSNPGIFNQLLALDTSSLISKGKQSLELKQVLIDEALQRCFRLRLGAGKYGECLGVHADDIYHLRSELGNQLAAKSMSLKLRPIGVVVSAQFGLEGSPNSLKVSLRSIGSSADTTEISEAYGGGGHFNASSFMISPEDFDTWKMG